jgi:hypothetical protein
VKKLYQPGHKKEGGRRAGTPNKPKTFAENLVEVHNGMSRSEIVRLDKRALELAMGQTIITESRDGKTLTSKVVSDPRLLIAIIEEVRKEQEKKRDFIAVPVSPEFYADTMKKLDEIDNDTEPPAKP